MLSYIKESLFGKTKTVWLKETVYDEKDDRCSICLERVSIIQDDCVMGHPHPKNGKMQCFVHKSCIKRHLFENEKLKCPTCQMCIDYDSIVSWSDIDNDYMNHRRVVIAIIATEFLLIAGYAASFIKTCGCNVEVPIYIRNLSITDIAVIHSITTIAELCAIKNDDNYNEKLDINIRHMGLPQPFNPIRTKKAQSRSVNQMIPSMICFIKPYFESFCGLALAFCIHAFAHPHKVPPMVATLISMTVLSLACLTGCVQGEKQRIRNTFE